MNYLENIEKILERISKVLVFLLLAFMSTSVFYAVICRYIFRSAPFWVEEVSRFMMVYMAFLGAAIAFRKRGHVGLEFVVARLIPERVRPYIILFSDILTLIFFFFVIYHGVRFASRGEGVISPATGISMLIAYCGVPIGCSFCFVQVFITMIRDLRKKVLFKKEFELRQGNTSLAPNAAGYAEGEQTISGQG